MKNNIDYDKPVAYDSEGRPLYAHPASGGVKSSKSENPIISEEVKQKHEKSQKDYPGLSFSDGEYVIASVKRHPIGLFAPFLAGVLLVSIALSILFNYDLIIKGIGVDSQNSNVGGIVAPVILFIIAVTAATCIAYYVYFCNKLILTNESVFQTIQTSLFSKREQTISLQNIEDASYTQLGIIQKLLNYGSIRLSTIGDENTYRLNYVKDPKKHIDILNNAVESFKNGRPIEL